MAKGHAKLTHGLVAGAAWLATVIAIKMELQLELDELVLLIWTIMLPLVYVLGLIIPVVRESEELRLYLLLIVVLPALLCYFYSGFVSFDEAVLIALIAAPLLSLVRMIRASLKQQLPQWNRDFWRDRLPEIFLLLMVGVLPVAASSEFGLMQLDDAVLLFFCVFSPIAFAIHDSPALRVARDALKEHPSIFKRISVVFVLVDALAMFGIAVLLPIYGYYGELQLEIDEAVMLFPCGLLPVYCTARVALGRLFSCMWTDVAGTISERLSQYGTKKALIAPTKNGGMPDFPPRPRHQPFEHGDLAAAEEAVRQERRSRHGAGKSPSAPTTPREMALGNGKAQHHWHHRHHHYGGDNSRAQLGPLPAHLKDPLAPQHAGSRPAKASQEKKEKQFKHKSHSLAASDAGALELPVYAPADPAIAEQDSGRRWHKKHGLDGIADRPPSSRTDAPGAKAPKDKGGGGGFFGSFFGRGKPPEPPVPEGRESQARWSDSSGSPSPSKKELRKSKTRSNSFSLSLSRRSRRSDDGDDAPVAGGRAAMPLDAPEAAADAADVQQLIERAPLRGKNAGANAEDLYSA